MDQLIIRFSVWCIESKVNVSFITLKSYLTMYHEHMIKDVALIWNVMTNNELAIAEQAKKEEETRIHNRSMFNLFRRIARSLSDTY